MIILICCRAHNGKGRSLKPGELALQAKEMMSDYQQAKKTLRRVASKDKEHG